MFVLSVPGHTEPFSHDGHWLSRGLAASARIDAKLPTTQADYFESIAVTYFIRGVVAEQQQNNLLMKRLRPAPGQRITNRQEMLKRAGEAIAPIHNLPSDPSAEMIETVLMGFLAALPDRMRDPANILIVAAFKAAYP